MADVRIKPELPVLPDEPTCPAAFPVRGASPAMRGCVCRLMQQDQEDDPGLSMSARALGRTRESSGGVYLNLKSDPSTVANFCHGSAVPVVTNDDGQGRASYTYCTVWQEARDRELAGLEGLTDPVVPEATSMGVSSMDAPDPWQAAREGLAELVQG